MPVIAKTNYSNLRREGLSILERIMNIFKREKSIEETWKKILFDELKLKEIMAKNILESLKVIFEEFSSDSNLDIKEKSKSLLKTLYTLI